MKLKLRSSAALLLSLPLALLSTACGDTSGTGAEETAGSETATGTGDEVGDGDGDPTTTTTGDGDGDPTTTGDGDGDPGCPVGSEGCPCTNGGGCDPGLTCDSGVCSPDATTGDGDGDPTTGDGDGDPTTGDGDGDPGNACVGDEFIPLEAEAADEIDGWFEQMSMLGEDVVLAWDNQNDAAFATWNIDVPCDDTWHIWVRAINAGQSDSFFATVDGLPDPAAIFEIGCDQGPMQATYEWRELNWRDQMAPGCEYIEDPWVQDWAMGVHPFTLTYRESYAISKLWITNTDQQPPP